MKKLSALILVLAAAGLVLILMVRGGMIKEAMLKGAKKMDSYYRETERSGCRRQGREIRAYKVVLLWNGAPGARRGDGLVVIQAR